MTARRRVRATRAALAAGALGAALLWGVAAALLALAVAGALAWTAALPAGARASAPRASVAIGALAAAVVLWRARRVWSASAVALWIEERVPTLRYALVTALDPRWEDAAPGLERAVAEARWGGAVARAVARALAAPAVIVAAALAAAAILPAGFVSRMGAPDEWAARRASGANAAATGSRLASITVTVTPPAYSGLAASSLDDPSIVTALASSSVRVEGRGKAAGIAALVGGERLDVRGDGGRWRVIFAMPARPAALRLRDGAERIVALAPRPDSAPVVTLVAPPRDTVLRAPAGAFPLAATATDDFGIAAVWLEYIVSSGEGESFTFRTGVARRARVPGARAYTLRAALPLDSLALKPGDIVHVRAVAVDGNSATGPDTGTSETRALRVPRAGEHDSVAVDGAPPPDVGQTAPSERMLIQLAEALERRRPRLPRATVAGESRTIASDQARLRRRVGDVIFARLGRDEGAEEPAAERARTRGALTPEQLLAAADSATAASGAALDFEGDETPVVAVNRPLLEAYDAMWAAERELGVGEPGAALPHMYAALAAIQRARSAERLYLRGAPSAVVVDLARVRLAGKLDGAAAGPRAPRPPVDTSAVRRAARLDHALALLPRDAPAAVDSLLLLRVEALESDPALAAALGPAIDALRAGRDATDALALARRAAEGAPVARGAVSAWGAAW